MKAVATIILDVPPEKSNADLKVQLSNILKTWTVWPSVFTHASSIYVMNVEKIGTATEEPPLQVHVSDRTVYALFGERTSVCNAFSAYIEVAPELSDYYAKQVAGRLAYSWNALKSLPLPHLHASNLSVVPPEEPYGLVKEQRDEALALLDALVSTGYVWQKDVNRVKAKLKKAKVA